MGGGGEAEEGDRICVQKKNIFPNKQSVKGRREREKKLDTRVKVPVSVAWCAIDHSAIFPDQPATHSVSSLDRNSCLILYLIF